MVVVPAVFGGGGALWSFSRCQRWKLAKAVWHMKRPRNIARAGYLLPEKALTRAQLLSAFGLIALSLLPSAHTLNSAQALRRGHPAQAFQTELVREFKGVSEVENATANLPRHRQRRDTSQDAQNTINGACMSACMRECVEICKRRVCACVCFRVRVRV